MRRKILQFCLQDQYLKLKKVLRVWLIKGKNWKLVKIVLMYVWRSFKRSWSWNNCLNWRRLVQSNSLISILLTYISRRYIKISIKKMKQWIPIKTCCKTSTIQRRSTRNLKSVTLNLKSPSYLKFLETSSHRLQNRKYWGSLVILRKALYSLRQNKTSKKRTSSWISIRT